MYDTIIIGAGMSGLAAGIRLAHFDQRVCILERHSTIGGLNSFYRLRGRDYDVGLHAVTNFRPKGAKKGPLARLLRQLRFKWDDFALAPQIGSSIRFPDVELQFNNDVELLTSQIAEKFPGQQDGFRALIDRLLDYDDLDEDTYRLSTRSVLEETIGEPILREMLLCPLMWYGNAREHDMDFGQFCIMFRSIFLEGFARPFAGVRLILRNLVRRFRGLGGELRLRAGVDRIVVEQGRACGVVLDTGEQIEARNVLSSAGVVETMRLCDGHAESPQPLPGEMSFIETISVLDCQPQQIGHDRTIVFFNDSERFHWERPRDELCDVRSGVICSPNNYLYGDEGFAEGFIRVTLMADHDRWCGLPEEEYRLQKLRWCDRTAASSVRFMPDYRQHVIDTDMFTPRTIHRFTWHDNGAVYGAPEKKLDGTTSIEHLYLCGSDQGFVGIVGAILSGITVANQHLLRQGS